MLMIRPARRFIMPLMTARVVWNAPLRLASSTASQSASVSRSRMLSRVRPALLTRMSIGPRACSAAAIGGLDLIALGHVAADPGRAARRARRRPAAARACSRPTTATLAPAAVERSRDGEADAAGAAGDEGGLAAEVDGRHAVRSCEEPLHLVGGPERDAWSRRARSA